jgi:hypothetical protein
MVITAGLREVQEEKACDKRHPYRIITIIVLCQLKPFFAVRPGILHRTY